MKKVRQAKNAGPPQPHLVPSSGSAISVLEKVTDIRQNEFVFPGYGGRHLLEKVMLVLMDRMKGREHLTPHGFRSTFQDWVEDCTDYPEALVEMALAHKIKNKVKAA